MLLSDITSLYWSGGKPTVTCACSYETEECHGLLCYYYMFMGDDVMVTGQWTHLGHTHTHTHTHIMCPLTALLLAGMFGFMTSLFCEWSLVQKSDCFTTNDRLSLSVFLSLVQEERRKHVREERSEDAQLSDVVISKFSSLVSGVFLPKSIYGIFDFISITSSLFPPYSLFLSPSLASLFLSCFFFFIFLFSFFLPSSKPSQQ